MIPMSQQFSKYILPHATLVISKVFQKKILFDQLEMHPIGDVEE